MKEMTRRDVLAGATALGAVGLAGCIADNDNEDNGNQGDDTDNSDNPDNDNNPEDSDSPDNGETADSRNDSELELLDTSVTTLEGSCGSGDLVEASIADGDVVLEGEVPASNPCKEAVLETTLEDGTLSTTVDLDVVDEDQVCTDCLGVIFYEATLEFSQDLSDLSALDSFTVEHGGRSDQTHTIEETGVVSGSVSRGEEGMSTDSTVLADSIVTTDRGCTGNVPPSDAPERVEADEETEVSHDGDTVTVSGSVSTSTPCHEAYIEGVGYDDGVLSLVVGAESNLDPDEMCVECLGEIEYEATVELGTDVTVEDVNVTHIEATG